MKTITLVVLGVGSMICCSGMVLPMAPSSPADKYVAPEKTETRLDNLEKKAARYEAFAQTDVAALVDIIAKDSDRSVNGQRAYHLLRSMPYMARMGALIENQSTLEDPRKFESALYVLFFLAMPDEVKSMDFDKELLGDKNGYAVKEGREAIVAAWRKWYKGRSASER
jgi:hypothetical protein